MKNKAKRFRELITPTKNSPDHKKVKKGGIIERRLSSTSTNRPSTSRTLFSENEARSQVKQQQNTGGATSITTGRSRTELSNESKQTTSDKNMSTYEQFKSFMIRITQDEESADAFREMMKPIIPDNTQEVIQLKEAVKCHSSRINYLENEVEHLKQQVICKTLLISGVKDEPEKSTEDIVTKLCRDKLGVNLHPFDCDGIFRLQKKANQRDIDLPPVIQVNLTTNRKKVEIMKNKKKLKLDNSDDRRNVIYINEKLTPKQNELFAAARALVKTKKLFATWTRDGRVYAKMKKDGRVETYRPPQEEQPDENDDKMI